MEMINGNHSEILRYKLSGDIKIKGKRYSNIYQKSVENGIDPVIVYDRLLIGLPLDEALKCDEPMNEDLLKKPRKQNKQRKIYDISEAKHFDKKKNNKDKKFKSENYSRRFYNVKLEGVTYHSFLKIAEKYNIDYSLGLQRINDGWTIQEVVGLVPRRNRYIFDCFGYTGNISGMCDLYGIPEYIFSNLINASYEPEEIVLQYCKVLHY